MFEGLNEIFIMLGVLAFLVVYFIPVIVASNRDHRHKDAILALNIVSGWTVIGWVASLVWALTAPSLPAKTRIPSTP